MNTTVVILAKSVKKGMHCVAGKEVNSRKWIRPVSSVEGAELSDQQCMYVNPYGRYKAKPLQKIEMNFSRPVPLVNQPENFLVSDQYWLQKYKIDAADLSCFLDTPDDLWGMGNRVSYAQIEGGAIKIQQSLYLIQADNLQLKMIDGKRRAIFNYADINYNLPVTDPNFENRLSNPDNRGILCISLGEKFDPYGGENYSCYKIVASIF
jgi:hypothetical protein